MTEALARKEIIIIVIIIVFYFGVIFYFGTTERPEYILEAVSDNF